MTFLRSISGTTWLLLAAVVLSVSVFTLAARHLTDGEDPSGD